MSQYAYLFKYIVVGDTGAWFFFFHFVTHANSSVNLPPLRSRAHLQFNSAWFLVACSPPPPIDQPVSTGKIIQLAACNRTIFLFVGLVSPPGRCSQLQLAALLLYFFPSLLETIDDLTVSISRFLFYFCLKIFYLLWPRQKQSLKCVPLPAFVEQFYICSVINLSYESLSKP
jgi:hypothetical protein